MKETKHHESFDERFEEMNNGDLCCVACDGHNCKGVSPKVKAFILQEKEQSYEEGKAEGEAMGDSDYYEGLRVGRLEAVGKIQQKMQNAVLFIGDEIPEEMVKDSRPKCVFLGSPFSLIDVASITKGEDKK